jgi:alkanesulfonate monooxygenase SsuD/methylene tetrahydromethanopterin reductase-like flavin-dependent oxidoreductase (luciferase family)
MKFHWFHLMPYPYLPDDFRRNYRSVWVDIPQELYDPPTGHEVYHTYLDELEFADQVGFDGICVNEHHQNGYGLMPSPNIMAATLTRRTRNAKIVVLGNSVALYNPPTRVAEEMAMLDVLSGGRLVSGFPLGTNMDTTFCYGLNPATLRDRYYEGVELILRAWTEREPFSFNGKYTQLRYVNLWPRPVQQPHPPVWIPGGGSIETWDWCIENNFLYAYLSYFGYKQATRTMEGFWEAVDRLGAEPNPYRTGFLQPIAVADSDAHAEELYSEAALYFYNRCLSVHPGWTESPGYTTLATIRKGIRSAVTTAVSSFDPTSLTWKDIVDRGYIMAGSPDTIVDQMNDMAKTMRIGHVMLLCHFGNLDKETVLYNTERFARDVAPRVRHHFDDEWEDHWYPRGTLDELAVPAPLSVPATA